MKPVSEVITSPGTTKSFLSEGESDKDTGLRIVGNLMSAAMLLLLLLLLLSLSWSWQAIMCILPPPTEI